MHEIKYKLVDENLETRNNTQWRIGKTVHATGDPNQDLCSDGWLHCYDGPELAAFLNPIHAGIRHPRMLVVKCEGDSKDHRGLKRGYRTMTPVLYMDCPRPTTEQCIKFAILCVRAIYNGPKWDDRANEWFSGGDIAATAAAIVRAAAAVANVTRTTTAKNVNLVALAQQAMED